MHFFSIINLFFGSLISILLYIFINKKIFNLSQEKNNILLILIFSVLIMIINIFNKDFYKILITIPILTIYFSIIYNINIEKSFVYIIFDTFYAFIGELIVGILFSILPITYSYIFNNVLGGVIGSFLVVIFTLPLLYLKPLSLLLNRIILKINNRKNLIYAFLFLMLIGSITYKDIHGLNNIYSILINIIIFSIFIVLTYMFIKQIHKTYEIEESYNILLEYIDKYEKELENKRKIIHDFRNNLIVINAYISKNNKKLKNYMDEIIKEQREIKTGNLLIKLDNMPRGLKGLLYYKFSQLNKKTILNINIENSIKKVSKIDSKTSKNTLKIIGILIDNAIEAVDNKGYINMDFSIKKNVFVVKIENSYKNNNLKKEKLFNIGYSTKGVNRGYGLNIVNDIVRKNNNIDVNFDVEKTKFKVILKLDIKKVT